MLSLLLILLNSAMATTYAFIHYYATLFSCRFFLRALLFSRLFTVAIFGNVDKLVLVYDRGYVFVKFGDRLKKTAEAFGVDFGFHSTAVLFC